ncbi:hypothetical protein PENSPDRAFT_732757 [Peniophora sp. CONT]|nr:hypothetical protein PENSPDRAFT_732757 [Peniophora sp. CONT]
MSSYGESLPDQVDRVASLSDAQADLFDDVRELYRDRAALEKEYAAKLQLLTKKAVDKKAKKMAPAVVGDDPTKAWSEETLVQSTVENAYAKIIASMLNTAQHHNDVSEALTMQVIGPLMVLDRKNQDHRKKLGAFYQKLLSDRDKVFSDRAKAKSKYDAECDEVETYRAKQDRASDDKHAERAARQFEQQKADMLNAKNVYLISISTANQMQKRFYEEDIPALENQHQLLQTHFLTHVVGVLKHAQELQASHYEALKAEVVTAEGSLSEVSPPRDQALFIDHNTRPFVLPRDLSFEPSPAHYDNSDMSVEYTPKVYLQNRLTKSRAKLQELKPLLDAKRRDAEQARKVLDAYEANHSLGSADEAMETYLEASHQATLYDESRSALEEEIKLVQETLGGDEGSQSPHTFKSSSFTIPTECAHCRTSIWGLSKQGKTCKLCGISVHAKCELKVAADCTRVRGGHKSRPSDASASGVSRTQSVMSTSSSTISNRNTMMSSPATPTASSFAPEPQAEEEQQTARVLFPYAPTSPFELGVEDNVIVTILEEDDGSGWVKVADDKGGRGLVPASYVEVVGSSPTTPQASTIKSGPTGKTVRGLYDYEAQGPDELDVTEGCVLQLTPGGENYADGWWEGIDAHGKKGIFPSNYAGYVSARFRLGKRGSFSRNQSVSGHKNPGHHSQNTG